MKKWLMIIILSTLPVTGYTLLFAAPVIAADEYDLYFKAEHLTWKEFLNGDELLRESGLIFGVGGSGKWENRSLTFNLEGELFTGRTDYDGQTQAGTPVETDVDYKGFKVEGSIGWKFIIAENFSLEPFIGPALRYWQRDLQSTDIAAGYKEKWRSVYTRLGILGSYTYSERLSVFAEGGVKLPIHNSNEVNLFNITLEPGKKTSGFAEAGFNWKMLKTIIYYEKLKFSESKPESIGGSAMILQPESEADIFGVSIGLTL